MAAPACADRKFGTPNIDEPMASTISSPAPGPLFQLRAFRCWGRQCRQGLRPSLRASEITASPSAWPWAQRSSVHCGLPERRHFPRHDVRERLLREARRRKDRRAVGR